MGVPRAHSTRGQKGRRRSHLALKKVGLVSCSHCHKLILPHTVCKYCGFYNGREVINIIARELKKKEKKQKNKLT
jgi:large subunit ribosomal protein L32